MAPRYHPACRGPRGPRPLHGCRHGLPRSRAGPACAYCGAGVRAGSGRGSGRMSTGDAAAGSHRPGSLVVAIPGASFPSSPYAAHATRRVPPPVPGARGRRRASSGSREPPFCYPRRPWPPPAHRRRRSRLRARLRAERAELTEQLTTIEDETFAATQSDMSGDVGARRRVGRRGHGHLRAREGPLDREQRPRPAAEDRAGAQADGRRHLRRLRAVRQADREGAHQGAALRRPLHQGRPGAVPPVAP